MTQQKLTLCDRIERGLVGLLGLLAMIVGMVQVVGRYLFPAHAISWAEEVIVYLVVWGVMIISGQLVKTDGHVRPDLVLRIMPPGLQRWMEVFNCLVALAFCFGMVWYGIDITQTSYSLDETSSTDLQFPMWVYYSALPAGGLLMTVRYVIRLLRYLLWFDPATMALGHIPDHEIPSHLTQPAEH